MIISVYIWPTAILSEGKAESPNAHGCRRKLFASNIHEFKETCDKVLLLESRHYELDSNL